MVVHINRPPHSVRLHAWGRAETGWWGCVSWYQRIRCASGEAEMLFAAWVPAAALKRTGWSNEVQLPRAKLDEDSRFWPVPPIGRCWYVGAWLDGDPPCPPGITVVTGPAWRKKPRLAP